MSIEFSSAGQKYDIGSDRSTLEEELRRLLNSRSMENESDTPDWILADYMLECLEAFNKATNRRRSYYGHEGGIFGNG